MAVKNKLVQGVWAKRGVRAREVSQDGSDSSSTATGFVMIAKPGEAEAKRVCQKQNFVFLWSTCHADDAEC